MIAINETADEDSNNSLEPQYINLIQGRWRTMAFTPINRNLWGEDGDLRRIQVRLVRIDSSSGVISPEVRNDMSYSIHDLGIGTTLDGVSYVALLNSNGIEVRNPYGGGLTIIDDAQNVTALTVAGDSIIWAADRGDGPELSIFSVSTETRQSYFVNASSDEETEEG